MKRGSLIKKKGERTAPRSIVMTTGVLKEIASLRAIRKYERPRIYALFANNKKVIAKAVKVNLGSGGCKLMPRISTKALTEALLAGTDPGLTACGLAIIGYCSHFGFSTIRPYSTLIHAFKNCPLVMVDERMNIWGFTFTKNTHAGCTGYLSKNLPVRVVKKTKTETITSLKRFKNQGVTRKRGRCAR